MRKAGEQRRHLRSPKGVPVHVAWTDRLGGDKFLNGQTVDISVGGIRVEVREPIEKHTYVTVRCSAMGLHGRASVRTCSRKGMKYVLGLEFSGGLQWPPKSKALSSTDV
jgi:hypothetical protein